MPKVSAAPLLPRQQMAVGKQCPANAAANIGIEKTLRAFTAAKPKLRQSPADRIIFHYAGHMERKLKRISQGIAFPAMVAQLWFTSTRETGRCSPA